MATTASASAASEEPARGPIGRLDDGHEIQPELPLWIELSSWTFVASEVLDFRSNAEWLLAESHSHRIEAKTDGHGHFVRNLIPLHVWCEAN